MIQSWKGELGLELATFDQERKLSPTARFSWLRETVLARGTRLLVLDNTSHLFGGDENVKREVAAFMNLLNGLAAEMDGVVLLLGHPNKSGINNPGAGDANQFGGSVGWENQVRSRIFQSAADQCDPDVRVISNAKANYSSKGGSVRFRWYMGAFVRDEDLPAGFASTLQNNQNFAFEDATFLECLAEFTRQRRPVSDSKNAATYAPKIFAKIPEAKGLKAYTLESAMNRLLRRGAIHRGELWKDGNRKWVHGLKCKQENRMLDEQG